MEASNATSPMEGLVLSTTPSPAKLVDSHHNEHNLLSSSTSSCIAHDLEKPAAYPLAAQSPSSRPFQFNPRNWTLKMRILAFTGLFIALAAIVTAIAVPLALKRRADTTPAVAHIVDPPPSTLIANNTMLRTMPLGASITYGWLSTDGNGYREVLRELLARGGNTAVTYVGSRHNGTMTDNAVEGWPGYRIDQVWPKARASVPSCQPNLILLNVGTNDCAQNWNINATTKQSTANANFTANPTDGVGSRLRMLVDDLFVWAPNTTVVISTLIYNKAPLTNARVNTANRQFRAVAATLRAEGKHVVLADMSAEAGGPNMMTMTDRTHPNDVGYAMMANKWYEAIAEAGKAGFIVPVVD